MDCMYIFLEKLYSESIFRSTSKGESRARFAPDQAFGALAAESCGQAKFFVEGVPR